jgi:L-galactose dehydrogenase
METYSKLLSQISNRPTEASLSGNQYELVTVERGPTRSYSLISFTVTFSTATILAQDRNGKGESVRLSESTLLPQKSGMASSAMQYRTLGKTDLRISVIGFGASPLGDVFGPVNPSEGLRAIHRSIDEGINFFDVSPYYGHTLAEGRLGIALEGKRANVVLATKCGRYGKAHFDFSAERIRKSIDESLTRLKTDYVDLLQAHDVEFGNIDQIIHETIPAMRRLQMEGKARYIGITGYPLKTLIKIAGATQIDSILSYCRYNLLIDDMDTELVPFAETHGIGIVNASPLHMGVLTDRRAPGWHPAPPEVHQFASKAAKFCRSRRNYLAELALGFCFDYPRVASTLVGMSNVKHVLRNLHALTAPANQELVKRVKTILAPAANIVWPSGRAENSD